MKLQVNNKDAPALEFKDGRYYYTFTAQEDSPTVDIYSNCLGDTQLKKIQIERNPDMTYWVPPEVYEGNLSGIFKDLKEINFQMTETDSDFWGKIKINARGMLEEYHKGTLSAEFMRTAGGIETRLRDALTQSENRYSETAEGIRREISNVDGRVNTVTETVDGFKREVDDSILGVRSSITQLSNGIEQRITNATSGEFSKLTQRVNGLQTTIGDVSGNYSTLSQTVSGLQTKVSGRDGLESQITQLAGLIDQRVTRSDVQGIIQNSGDAIWLAVKSRVDAVAGNATMTGKEIINAINIAIGGVLIRSGDNKLMVTPETTYIQNGTIKSAHIGSLDASKITTGELNAANVRIINLDAGVITTGRFNANIVSAMRINVDQLDGNKANLLRASFSAVNSNVNITGTELRLENSDGSFVEMNTIPEVRSVARDSKEVVLGDGRVHFKDSRAISNGYIGVDLHTSTNKLGIYLARGTDFFQIAQGVSSTVDTGNRYYTVVSGDGWYAIASKTGVNVNTLLQLNGANINTIIHPGQKLLIRRGTTYTSSNLTYQSYIRFGMNSSRTNHEIYMDKPVTMTASPKISSDRRIKKNIVDSPIKALNEINKLGFKAYNLIETDEYYPIGLIAQDSGLLMRYNGTDDIYTIDLMTGLMLALKGLKELNDKVENLCQKKLA